MARLPVCAFRARQSHLYQGTYALYGAARACPGAACRNSFKLISLFLESNGELFTAPAWRSHCIALVHVRAVIAGQAWYSRRARLMEDAARASPDRGPRV